MPEGTPMPFDMEPKFTEKATQGDPREFVDFQRDHQARRLEIFGQPLSDMDTEHKPEPELSMLTREQLDSLDGKTPEEQERMIARFKRQNLESAN